MFEKKLNVAVLAAIQRRYRLPKTQRRPSFTSCFIPGPACRSARVGARSSALIRKR
jgi:hypothetical protein